MRSLIILAAHEFGPYGPQQSPLERGFVLSPLARLMPPEFTGMNKCCQGTNCSYFTDPARDGHEQLDSDLAARIADLAQEDGVQGLTYCGWVRSGTSWNETSLTDNGAGFHPSTVCLVLAAVATPFTTLKNGSHQGVKLRLLNWGGFWTDTGKHP